MASEVSGEIALWPEPSIRCWEDFTPEEQAAVLARLRERLSPQAKRARAVDRIMRRLEFGKHIVGFLGLVLLLLFASRAHAEHIAWMAPFRDADGISCCERTDCQAREILVLNAGRGMLMIDEIPLSIPPGSLYRIPPEAHEPTAPGYWCFRRDPRQVTVENTRCVFFKTPYW